MYQVAVYGKGGIGKSTMSANISFALSSRGMEVMQVGCDPKHDSTRLLLGGRPQTTVLDYVRSTPLSKRRLDDVVVEGSGGVLCVEAGGPEPGIGCAGRGILTTFDTLKKLGVDGIGTDVRIYDVLGDVVCGGFAVPLRSEYADGIILVTSGEFMSLYAANNIMKGIANFDSGKSRVIGLILNCRGMDGEEDTVRRFADATGVEIIGTMPRDRMFSDAEAAGRTVREMFPDSDISREVDAVADRIMAVRDGKALAVSARPLDDDQLSDLAAGRPIRPHSCSSVPVRTGCAACAGSRTSIKDSTVMSSCSAYGAVSAYMKMRDVAVVIHGPGCCLYMMDTSRSKAVLDLYMRGIYDAKPTHNLRCTMMDDTASVFGGNGMLERTLEETISEGFRWIAVVTTCMPGIIGDDCGKVIDELSARHPDVKIDLVPADGDITGEYTDGFMMAAETMAESIDLSVEPEPGYVNLIGSSFFDLHTTESKKAIAEMLARFGLKENCRFLDECSSEDVVGYCRASLDMMVSDTPQSRELAEILRRRTGREPFPEAVPVGLYDYQEWLRSLGEATSRTDAADAEIEHAEKVYDDFVASHRPRFEGKRAIIVLKMGTNFDWLVDLLLDLGVEICRIGVSPNTRRKRITSITRHMDMVTEEYTDEMLCADLDSLHPDLLIGDIIRGTSGKCRFARVGKVGLGVEPTLKYAQYLENVMRLPQEEGWKRGLRL